MDSDTFNSMDPNLLANMIRQKNIMGSFNMGSPMPEGSQAASPGPAPTDLRMNVHHFIGEQANNQPTVQPQVQEAMSSAAPQIPQVPINPTPNIPKVGPIDPNSENPAESAYKQSLMNEPMHANYHPSKLRNVLSTIAGMGVGAFQGGDAGSKLRHTLRDEPFINQHQDWAQFAGNREKLATEEEYNNTTSSKAALDASTILRNQADARKLNHDANKYEPTDEASAINLERNKLAGALPGENTVELEDLATGQKIEAIRDPSTGVTYEQDPTVIGNRGAVIPPEKLALMRQSERGKPISPDKTEKLNPFQLWMKQNQADIEAGKLTVDDWLEKQPERVQTEFATYKAGYLQKHPNANGTEIAASYAALPRPIPGVTVLSQQPSGEYRAIGARPGQTLPANVVTPSGASQLNVGPAGEREQQFQAQVIKRAGDNLIAKINQHRDKLGNLEDYWKQSVNNTPIADKDISGLMASLGSFAALQPKLHGFRGQQALKEFSGLIGGVPKDPDALIAAIQAIQDTAGQFGGSNAGPSNQQPVEEYVTDPITKKLVLKSKAK